MKRAARKGCTAKRPLDDGKAKLGATPEGEAGGEPVAGDERLATTDFVHLDHLAPGQSLGHAVAQRIAAAVDGATAEPVAAEPAPGLRGEKQRGAPVGANLALAIAAARRGDLAGGSGFGAAATPDFSVTRRETHFAPVSRVTGTPTDALADAARGALATGSTADAEQSADGARQAGPLPLARGRAEQVGLRGAPGEMRGGRGEAAGASASAPSGAAAGSADGTAAETPEGTLSQGAAAGGAGQARAAAALIGSGTAVQPPAPPAITGAAGPVKVLQIHLQPSELGTLEVTMRLTDAGLEVHIDANRSETLALLKNDREALAQVLRGTGHSADSVTVTFADRSAAQGHGQGQASQDGSQSSGARADTQAGAQSGAQAGAQPGTPREQGGRQDGGPSSRATGRARLREGA